eukprot:TRINITY_DN8092_c0_g2_i1.p1 TRINITY_DN8092_c0_g2~~TRINITY_DN8092_c0_g2_i1.p1  ORF type:complete len:384 (+),score=77.08 TRINITY_DN8092_c0_g2_i1:171-1154(+)
MREAMHAAIVGDDVYCEDPTVQKLEAAAAKLFGKEAALFVTSGTQANLCAIMAHCSERGSEVILGDRSHICVHEQGGIACLAGVHPRTVPNRDDGTLDLSMIEGAFRKDDVHFPRSRLVCLENSHNSCGGVALAPEYIDKVGELCKKLNLKLHIDGARIGNACVHYGVSAARMVQAADSLTLCLSKGLGAPAGSLVIGTKDLIASCRRSRKALGGGLRQVGVLAAPGMIAMTQMWDRLGEDSETAKAVAEGVRAALPHVNVEYSPVSTNMAFFSGVKGAEVVAGLRKRGVLGTAPRHDRIRLVFHHHIPKSSAGKIVDAFVAAVNES